MSNIAQSSARVHPRLKPGWFRITADIDLSKIPAEHLKMQMILERFYRENDECYPHNTTLAELYGCSLSTAKRILKGMRTAGWFDLEYEDPDTPQRGRKAIVARERLDRTRPGATQPHAPWVKSEPPPGPDLVHTRSNPDPPQITTNSPNKEEKNNGGMVPRPMTQTEGAPRRDATPSHPAPIFQPESYRFNNSPMLQPAPPDPDWQRYLDIRGRRSCASLGGSSGSGANRMKPALPSTLCKAPSVGLRPPD
jgi:hypothetical protein